MTVERLPYGVDQLMVVSDVTPAGGTMRVAWGADDGVGPFKILQ